MIVVGTGSRELPYRQYRAVCSALYPYAAPENTLIVGDARGFDFLALQAWKALTGVKPDPWEARWRRWGHYAGPMRNTEMVAAATARALETGEDVVCVAWPERADSGTHDCMRKAYAAGFEIVNLGIPLDYGQPDWPGE